MAQPRPVRNAARAEALGSGLGARVSRAWGKNPVVALLRHRRQVVFYQQLHALLASGTPWPTAFAHLVAYAPDARLARALSAMSRDVQGGSSLGEALARHGSELDDASVELLTFAERAGTLDEVVKTLIGHLERLQALRWRTLVLLLWPAYLLVALVMVGPLLGVAQSIQPGASIGSLYVAGLARSLGWLLAVGGGLVALPLVIAGLGLGTAWDRLKRALPLVSTAVSRLYAARFVMTLGLGAGAGMEVFACLRAAVKATGSPSLGEALPKAEDALRAGASLTEAVGRLELVEQSTLGTIAVAERTGTLDESLAKASHELEASALRAVQGLMLAVVALLAVVLVGSIVVAILKTALGSMMRLHDAAGSGALGAP